MRYSLIFLLLLSACQQPAMDNGIKDSDLRSGHTQRMFLGVPGALVEKATDSKKPLNLNDPEQVAHALGVKLNGDPHQVLYVMQMTAPSSEQGTVKREIPIRVDNIHQGASMIREWQM